MNAFKFPYALFPQAILASHPDAQTAIDFIIAADDKAQQQPKKPAPGMLPQ
jgi:hypothetical protein